jgi:ADP-heptose:LPS heptosyltransferase
VRKLILRNFQSPGDIVMLTAAVRDLHRCHPGQFLTDVRTSCPALWEHNPHLTPLSLEHWDVEILDCHYPLIHRSNTAPYHFLHGFIEYINDRLGLQIRPTEFRGDIHISEEEKAWFSRVEAGHGGGNPFWLLVSGGKFDYTIKWWDHERYQQVVDHFRGRIEFVQVGEAGHSHPPLEGVVDLRGQTSLRQLVRLVYHAQGVLSPISLLMHLAAAVPVKPESPKNRPCVVIAGGREPPHFTAYPHHQFIHTVGALRCCDNGGCWKSRTLPLGDGDVKDDPSQLCVDVVGRLPRCMDMITAEEVIRRIEMYFTGGALRYLSEDSLTAVQPHSTA